MGLLLWFVVGAWIGVGVALGFDAIRAASQRRAWERHTTDALSLADDGFAVDDVDERWLSSWGVTWR